MPKQLRVNGVIEESIVDGPGIRYAIFAQGCPHACVGCHNPDTHSFDAGYDIDVYELFECIKLNPLVTGVTFSGGEPMCQSESLYFLAEKIKSIPLKIAVYTGYTFEELLNINDEHCIRLLSLCDVLIDGRFEQNKRDLNLLFKGSSNQRVLDLRQSMINKQAVIITDKTWVVS